jgi:hypothetical protein
MEMDRLILAEKVTRYLLQIMSYKIADQKFKPYSIYLSKNKPEKT